MNGPFYELLTRNCGRGDGGDGRSYHGSASGESI